VPCGPGAPRTQHGPKNPVPSGRGRPLALRSSATRDRSAGRARQGRCKPRPTDPLLAKPDRAGLPPATIENGAGRGRCGVVRGCPLRTGRDRCEWHGSGTPDEDDVRRARKSRHQLDRRVRPDPGDTRLVGKGRRRPAAAGRWDSKPPPRWPGDRGQEREGAGTCETAGCRESQDERTASMSVLTLTAQAMQGDRERFPGRGLRQLPLQTSERRQARPHGAATVPGRG
jgi:hypothetical protein